MPDRAPSTGNHYHPRPIADTHPDTHAGPRHLSELRKQAGHPTPGALAATLGLAAVTVRRWENGTRSPPPGLAQLLRLQIANRLNRQPVTDPKGDTP
jgi:DNA-binding transcriptional regulator YiaG